MAKWLRKRPADISHLKAHPALSGLSDITLQILVGRGYTTPEQIEKMLFGGIKDLHDPRKMKDAELAISIIQNAIQNGDFITVYGDYDCDGVTSTAIMTMLLEKAGAKVGYFTNNRFVHGYGMCPQGVDDLLALYPETKLIVTVDNGISAHEGVKYAKEKGIQVVVTDHHDPADTLPPADAVVNPKRQDCPYPFKHLCGAGVAFKLMLLLYWEMGLPLQEVYDTMDIAALGTVADIVPLEDENRIIVSLGLKMIEDERRAVFRILRQITQVKQINAHYTIGFIYGPMINAIGRLDGDPKRAIDMFFEEDETKIENTVRYLMEINEIRKQMTEDQTEQADELLNQKGLQYVNVIYHPDFHEGIVGLIAGRLKEKYNRPVFVLTKVHGMIKGSGRGIDGFHLKGALDKIKHLLKGYGGHAKACGLSMEEENLQAFEEEMNKLAKECLNENDFEKVICAEYVFQPSELTIEVVDALRELEPFGEKFPKPTLAVNNFRATQVYYMGNERQHVKLRDGNVELIMWGLSEWYKHNGEPQLVKAIGFPELNVWNNRVTVQFVVQDDLVRPVTA